MVLGPEQKIPDGNLQLCVIDSFLFEIMLYMLSCDRKRMEKLVDTK